MDPETIEADAIDSDTPRESRKIKLPESPPIKLVKRSLSLASEDSCKASAIFLFVNYASGGNRAKHFMKLNAD